MRFANRAERPIAVTDDELIEGARELARTEGIFAAPEGRRVCAGARKLHRARQM